MRTIVTLLILLATPAAVATGFVLPESRGELRLVVLGDFNGPYGTVGYSRTLQELVATVISWQPDLVLLPGDLVAGQDQSLPDGHFELMWAGFDLEVAAPLRAAGIPFAAAMGNHDASSLRSQDGFTFQRERNAAKEYWDSVSTGLGVLVHDRSDYPFNWSFSVGGLFVVVWDASSAMVSSRQTDWLNAQLAGTAAGAAEWRWLVGHLPFVGVAERRARAGEVLEGGTELAARLAEAGLDTYVSGHQGAWYPARLEGLELLMSGGIGGRPLIAGGAPIRSTVTVVDLGPEGVHYTTFDVPSGETVDPAELPQTLEGWGGSLRLSERASPPGSTQP